MPNSINDLENNLKFALANVALRQQILDDISQHVSQASITDAELVQIYEFVLALISAPKSILTETLESMPENNTKLIARSTKDKDYPNTKPLPRSIMFTKEENYVRVGFIENSKTANGKNDNLKLVRSKTTVSRLFDITPGYRARLAPRTTKSYRVGEILPTKTTPKLGILTLEQKLAIDARREKIKEIANTNAKSMRRILTIMYTARQLGMSTQLSDSYTHKGLQAVRTLEPAYFADLFTIFPFMDKWGSEYTEVFIYNTVFNILRQMAKLHDERKSVHTAIFPETIGFVMNSQGGPEVQLKDFEHSDVPDCTMYPVARSAFCSPKVVVFNRYAQESMRREVLHTEFSTTDQSGEYIHTSFAREILDLNHLIHGVADPSLLYPFVNELRFDYTDDMFSLGVSLFILITRGHYPTATGLQGKAYDNLNYMRIQDAYRQYPQYAPLLKGMLSLDNSSFTAAQALEVFKQIPYPMASKPKSTDLSEELSSFTAGEQSEVSIDERSASSTTASTVSPPTNSAVKSPETNFATSSKSAFTRIKI